MNIEEIISMFAEKHPIWTRILARLVVCVCACTIAALGFFGFVFAVAPFVFILEDGTGAEAFAWWLGIPLIATGIWILLSVIGMVYEGVIE